MKSNRHYTGEFDMVAVLDFLKGNYSLEELQGVADRIMGDHEGLPGNDTKANLARELVLYCQRHGLVKALMDAIA